MRNSPQDFHNKLLGRRGEEFVVKYLKKKGYRIVARNYVTPFGEADIIAYKKGEYAFVEVKARESDCFGLPSEAVNEQKQRKYRLIAKYFCTERREELPVRYDVAALYEGGLEYFEGAFI